MSVEATVRPALAAHSVAGTRLVPTSGAREHWRQLAITLLVLDALALTAAVVLAYLLRFKAGVPLLVTPSHSIAFYSSVAFWAVPAWLGIFAVYRLYDRQGLF